MSEIVPFSEPQEEESNEPLLETPTDMRPDLAALGLQEHERGVVEDTYENRQVLRQAKLNWDAVYDQQGRPTGLISARSQEQNRERRILALNEKRPLLVDPDEKNSEYLTGLDLLVDEAACRITPPWVVNSTRAYLKEQENGGPSNPRRAPLALPHRCRMVKSDGIRCLLWSSGRIKDDGLCRIHLRSQRKPGEDVERARRKLMQSAPYAVDVLEELMETATSEPVRLKASSEILDRAGVRGGMDIGLDVEVTDSRSPAQIVQERLARLAAGAARVIEVAGEIEEQAAADIQDAEVVEESIPAAAAQNSEKDGERPDPEVFTSFLPETAATEEDEDAAIQTEGFDADELDV